MLDDLDLDARSQWVAKAKNCVPFFSTISIKLGTTAGHFLRELDFENVYMA